MAQLIGRIEASAPGKLVFLGEYAVLEGAPALVAAVDRRVCVTIEASDGPHMTVEAPDIGAPRVAMIAEPTGEVSWADELDDEMRERLGLVSAVVAGLAQALARQGRALPPCRLRIDSATFHLPEVRGKLGIGSSAALSVALCGGLLSACGVDVSRESGRRRVLSSALALHRQAQGGGGSGIDVAASTFGGVLRFERADPRRGLPALQRLSMPQHLETTCVWSGRPAVTSGMVSQVLAFGRQQPAIYAALIRELADIAARGCAAIANGDVGIFLTTVVDYESTLGRLGTASGVDIVSSEHQHIGNVVRANGGVYKPSGAGGGDLGLAFTGSREESERVGDSLHRAGFTIVPISFGDDGLRVSIDHD